MKSKFKILLPTEFRLFIANSNNKTRIILSSMLKKLLNLECYFYCGEMPIEGTIEEFNTCIFFIIAISFPTYYTRM